MQRTTPKIRMSTGKVLIHSAQVLPCVLEKIGCETASLDPFAYICVYPDNCVLSVLRTKGVNMVKQGRKYDIISGHDSTTKLVFEEKTILKNIVESRQLITRPIAIHSIWQQLAEPAT